MHACRIRLFVEENRIRLQARFQSDSDICVNSGFHGRKTRRQAKNINEIKA